MKGLGPGKMKMPLNELEQMAVVVAPIFYIS